MAVFRIAVKTQNIIIHFKTQVHQLKGNKTHHNRSNTRCNTRKNEKQQAAESLTYIIRPPEDG
jgi:hypothetical protein